MSSKFTVAKLVEVEARSDPERAPMVGLGMFDQAHNLLEAKLTYCVLTPHEAQELGRKLIEAARRATKGRRYRYELAP